jgi:hypothetical protein
MSLPESATGIPWIWIGDGFLIPRFAIASSKGGGIFISRKLGKGGGTPAPLTAIWCCSLTRCLLCSEAARHLAGGFHPVWIEDV